MENLRLWILLVGLVFIAAVYGWGKYQERRAARRDGFDLVGGAPEPPTAYADSGADDDWDVLQPLRAERAPSIDVTFDESVIPVLEDVVAPAPQPVRSAPPMRESTAAVSNTQTAATTAKTKTAEKQELIVVLGITALPGREFNGAELAPVFEKAGLYYGDMNIFHAPVDLERPDGPVLFSIANMVEPGTLEPEKLKLLSTPGLFLFTRLPGRVNGVETFEHLHSTAQFLARTLNGTVCDERRQPLTEVKTVEIRERIQTIIGDTVVVPDD